MIDMPDVSPQYAPVVVIAQASQAQKGDAKTDRTIGVCHLIENPPVPPESAVNFISPVQSVWGYLEKQERPTPGWLTADVYNAAKATIQAGPGHGKLKDEGSGDYHYHPTADYYGQDRATVLVEVGGLKVKVTYFFKVMRIVSDATDSYDPYRDKKLCPNGMVWKISLNLGDPDGGLISYQHLK